MYQHIYTFKCTYCINVYFLKPIKICRALRVQNLMYMAASSDVHLTQRCFVFLLISPIVFCHCVAGEVVDCLAHLITEASVLAVLSVSHAQYATLCTLCMFVTLLKERGQRVLLNIACPSPFPTIPTFILVP